MVQLYTSPAFAGHVTPPGHPERVDRLRAVEAGLQGLTLTRTEGPLAPLDEVTRCHPRAYVDRVATAVPAEGWGLVLFAGLASSLLAAYCWMRGLATLGAERTSVFMNLMPLCTALLAVITIGEPIHGYHLLGGGRRRHQQREQRQGQEGTQQSQGRSGHGRLRNNPCRWPAVRARATGPGR